MTKIDKVFIALENKKIEVMFKSDSVFLTFLSGLVKEYRISDFGKLENLAKFISHEQGLRYHAK